MWRVPHARSRARRGTRVPPGAIPGARVRPTTVLYGGAPGTWYPLPKRGRAAGTIAFTRR